MRKKSEHPMAESCFRVRLNSLVVAKCKSSTLKFNAKICLKKNYELLNNCKSLFLIKITQSNTISDPSEIPFKLYSDLKNN